MLSDELQELRKDIDRIDKQIVNLIDERMKVSLKVGETKKKYNAPIFGPKKRKRSYSKKNRIA
ncbi:chorismate mutase [Brachyspira hyodysenteriae]|nr:chorismate mutase [Brachyspira hyodysenteriae]MCZ9892960.1 chorismate mutase [Brachyspira hyodysenteriae]MCZ9990506.1 chorismate mutase [Brachyspira hyodysenteriae]MCZ9999823.1 chorismate mutase [Brachyspira hyodysenteriae]MDA0007313.1 chorismate mutase [Brachyspira hyodysenteriae]MDA0030138.1 chorismate mutase [Brachyspira hyodysenteriae]